MEPNTQDDRKPAEESQEHPVVVGSASRKPSWSQFTPLFKMGLVAFLLLAGSGSYALVKFNAASKPVAVTTTAHTAPAPQAEKTAPKQPATDSQSKSASQTPAAAPTTKKSAAGTSSPVPQPAPAPSSWVNTTNCLPQNPSPYATDYIGKTNSQYLQTDSYANTSKFYAALQFAGLASTVNIKQYTVFAPDDYVWDHGLTSAQLTWMNASPANMRAVLGWHIATSCVTWAGVNPVNGLAIGTHVTVNTLNGPVTYVHGSPGTLGNGGIAMWDWFTSNGSVTFVTGFVNTSAAP